MLYKKLRHGFVLETLFFGLLVYYHFPPECFFLFFNILLLVADFLPNLGREYSTRCSLLLSPSSRGQVASQSQH